MDTKVGELLRRKMDGFRPGEEWTDDAEVIEVQTDIIICHVMVDVMRRMHFRRSDGVNVNGRAYGWLERPA